MSQEMDDSRAEEKRVDFNRSISNLKDIPSKWLFVLPAVLYAVILVIPPMVDLIRLSLSQGGQAFVGLENYIALLTDSTFHLVLANTLLFVVPSTISELVLGTVLALAFYKKFKFKNSLQTIFLLPMVLTPFAIGLMFQWFFSSSLGIVNYQLNTLGLQSHTWLGDPALAMFTVILADVWQWTPFIFLMAYATLQSVPESLIEAAKIDGAGRLQRFRYILLPHLYPVLLITTLIKVIIALKTSDKIFAITGGGPGSQTKTLTMYIYELTFEFNAPGRGAALSVIFLILIIIIGNVFLAFLSRAQREV